MKRSFIEIMALSETLLQQERAHITERLKSSPDCPKLEWKLAELLRQCGELDEALTIYRRTNKESPHYEKASKLVDIFSGEHTQAAIFHGREHPTPYVYLRNFLSPELCDSLWKFVVRKQELFGAAVTRTENARDVVASHYLNSLRLPLGELEEIKAWFSPLVAKAIDASYLKPGREPPSPASFEVALVSYSEGHFHRLHQDVGPKELATRAVTANYYFYRHPKSFSGGDILLHDTDIAISNASGNYTRIAPEANSLLIFPSRIYHQVTPVRGPRVLEQNRFALIAWMHRLETQSTRNNRHDGEVAMPPDF